MSSAQPSPDSNDKEGTGAPDVSLEDHDSSELSATTPSESKVVLESQRKVFPTPSPCTGHENESKKSKNNEISSTDRVSADTKHNAVEQNSTPANLPFTAQATKEVYCRDDNKANWQSKETKLPTLSNDPFCDMCEIIDAEIIAKADCKCLDCTDNTYYCNDCFQKAHKRKTHSSQVLLLANGKPLPPDDKSPQTQETSLYKSLPTDTKKTVELNHEDKTFMSQLRSQRSAKLPWIKRQPNLFQILEVVFDQFDYTVVEKVVVVEEEFAALCNILTPRSCKLDCTEIKFDALNSASVVSIGITGANTAVYKFLQDFLHLSTEISYEEMTSANFCPTGLYALMPTRSTLFFFYWRSVAQSAESENESITCRMLRHLRDFCSEIVLCFDEAALSSLVFPRPEDTHKENFADYKVNSSNVKLEAEAKKGFCIELEMANERSIFSQGGEGLHVCTPQLYQKPRIAASGKKKVEKSFSELLSLTNNFKDYRVIWKPRHAELSASRTSEDPSPFRDFLAEAFPKIEQKLDELDKEQNKLERDNDDALTTVRSAIDERKKGVLDAWKKTVGLFFQSKFSPEEGSETKAEECSSQEGDGIVVQQYFSSCKKEIAKQVDQLRKKTAVFEKLSADGFQHSEEEEKTFFSFETTVEESLEALSNETRLGKTWNSFRELPPKQHSGASDLVAERLKHNFPDPFCLPGNKDASETHMRFYNALKGKWRLECPSSLLETVEVETELVDKQKLLEKELEMISFKRKSLVKKSTLGTEIGEGKLSFTIHSFEKRQNLCLLDFEYEYEEKALIPYQVGKLYLSSAQLGAAIKDKTVALSPNFIWEKSASFHLEEKVSEARALYAIHSCKKMLLVVYTQSFNTIARSQETSVTKGMIIYVGELNRLTQLPMHCLPAKNIHLTLFDSATRVLALWDEKEKILAVYKFSQAFDKLEHQSDHFLSDVFPKPIQTTSISVKNQTADNEKAEVDAKNEKEISCIKFLNNSDKIIFISKDSLACIGRIYDWKRKEALLSVLDLTESPQVLRALEIFQDYALIVYSTRNEPFRAKAFSISKQQQVGSDPIFCFKASPGKSLFQLVKFHEHVYLACIDLVTKQCESALLNLSCPKLHFASESKEEQLLSAAEKRSPILEQFHTIFRKYPVKCCYDKSPLKPLQLTFVFPTRNRSKVGAENFLQNTLKNLKGYFKDMFFTLQDDTGKSVSELLTSLRLQTCFEDDVSRLFCFPYLPIKAGDLFLAIATSVPIQIAMASFGKLRILSKGLTLNIERSLNNVDDFIRLVSFGVYEGVFKYSKNPVKVLSAKGLQSSGKSFLLNHVADTLFDISGGRCTKGIWLSVKIHPDITLVALDFEGLGSFERSRQEDMLMAVFGSAVSSLTVFKTGPRFNDDTKRMFSRFEDGVSKLNEGEKSDNLFKGKLTILCRDVAKDDAKEVIVEMRSKIETSLTRKDSTTNNFVELLYGGKLRIACSSPIGKKEFMQSFVNIKVDLDAQVAYPSTKTVAPLMKTVLAKVHLQDWTAVDRTLLKLRLDNIEKEIATAVCFGCVLKAGDENDAHEPLLYINKYDIACKVEDVKVSEAPGVNDYKLELYSTEKRQRRELRKRLFKEHQSKTKYIFGSDDWCNTFKQIISALIKRRIDRVKSWILSNARPEFSDDAYVTKFLFKVDAKFFSPMQQFWTFCRQQCFRCFRLCLHTRYNESEAHEHDCFTNHTCVEYCLYCSDRNVLCGRKGGHSGKHMCSENSNNHTCKESCYLSKFRGCNGNCAKTANHACVNGHTCDADAHYCTETCQLPECQNVCSQKANHDGKHKCSENRCIKTCVINQCTYLCSSTDHFHSAKVHLCNNEHRCLEQCEIKGFCAIQPWLQKSEKTFQGHYENFEYTYKAKQKGKKDQCVISIPVGETSHEGLHCCRQLSPDTRSTSAHYCEKRCPTCENICSKLFGHEGRHDTTHSNMDNQVFVGKEGPLQIGGHVYRKGESAVAETCDMFCKERGRGHTHYRECPEHSGMQSSSEARHSSETEVGGKKIILDEVKHEFYWETIDFVDKSSEEERQLFKKCNVYCSTLDEPPKFSSNSKSFCQLDLWHDDFPPSSDPDLKGHVTSGHHFACDHELYLRYHVVLLIDKSASMGSRDQRPNKPISDGLDCRLGAVIESVQDFCYSRYEAKTEDVMTIIAFCTSHTILRAAEQMAPNTDSVFKQAELSPCGGTLFAPPLFEAAEAITRYSKKSKGNKEVVPVVILLSDGDCSDEEDALRAASSLKSNYVSDRAPFLYCVRFGNSDSGLEVLKSMSFDNIVHKCATTIELAEMFRKISALMNEDKIGVIRKDIV